MSMLAQAQRLAYGARRPRRVRVRRPATEVAHRCAVLAIDAGETSGVAFGLHGQLLRASAVTDHDLRERIVREAVASARNLGVPLIVVAEKWRRQGNWGFQQAQGTAAQWGKWLAALEHVGTYKLGRAVYPKIVRVYPGDWRARVLGNAFLRKDAAKRLAVQRAVHELGAIDDHNAAEAACMAIWGMRAGEVGKLLPKGVADAR
jgi:hypothetical protein